MITLSVHSAQYWPIWVINLIPNSPQKKKKKAKTFQYLQSAL